MKMSPCKDCKKRHTACHDTCEVYIKWAQYVKDTKHKLNMDKTHYRSTATRKAYKIRRKKNSAKYMRNKF